MPETMNIQKENIGSEISDIAHSNILSDISPQARETREKINKWDYIKGDHQQRKKSAHRMG